MVRRFFRWLFRGTGNRVFQWFGWGIGKDFYQECRRIRDKVGHSPLAARKKTFQENMHLENDFRAMPFSDLLERWGIHTVGELADAIQACRRARLAGFLLTSIFGTLCAWQILILDQALWWRTLHGFAGLSFLLAGLLRWATAAWRLRVFQHKTFVPFTYWLTRLGNVSWQKGQTK